MINNSHGYEVEARVVFARVDDAVGLVAGDDRRLLRLGRNGIGIGRRWGSRIVEHDAADTRSIATDRSSDALIEAARRISRHRLVHDLVRWRSDVECL